MRLKDIAAEIDSYLKMFEANSKINSYADPKRSTKPYFWAGAWQAGRYVMVMYISYQSAKSLTRPEAEKYLIFLRGGGVGKHFLV